MENQFGRLILIIQEIFLLLEQLTQFYDFMIFPIKKIYKTSKVMLDK